MKPLDSRLADPRTHRAVPQQEMIDRVVTRTLARHQPAAVAPARGARLTVPRAARWWALAGLSLLASYLAIRQGWLPRLDLWLEYWLTDLGVGLREASQASPLTTALSFAAGSALLGFGLSSRARASWRATFSA